MRTEKLNAKASFGLAWRRHMPFGLAELSALVASAMALSVAGADAKALDRSEAEGNLLLNPGFEEMENGSLKAWSAVIAKGEGAKLGRDMSERFSGESSASMDCPEETEALFSQTVPVKGGETYVLEVNYKAKEFRSSHHLAFAVAFSPVDAAKGYVVLNPPGTCGWKKFSKEFTASAAATQATISIKNYLVKGTLWLDDIYFGPQRKEERQSQAERKECSARLGCDSDFLCVKMPRGGEKTVVIPFLPDVGAQGQDDCDAYEIAVRPPPEGLIVEPEKRVVLLSKKESVGSVRLKLSLSSGVPEWFCEKAVIDIRPASRYGGRAVACAVSVAAARRHPFLFVDGAEVEKAKERALKTSWGRQAHDEIIAAAAKQLTYDLAKMPSGKNEREHLARMASSVMLGQAYLLSGDERYAQKAREIFLSYADGYKTLPKRSSVDGRATGQTINESEWALGLVAAYDYVYESPAFSAEDHDRIERDFLRNIVDVLLASRRVGWMQCSNWGAAQNATIGAIGFLLQDRTLIDDAISSEFGFAHQIGHDLLDDGQWWEGAPGYHYETVCYGFIPLAEAAWHSGMDLYNQPFPGIVDCNHADGQMIPEVTPGAKRLRAKSLVSALTGPISATFPDGSFPPNNDSSPFFIGEYGAANYELGYLRCKDPGEKKKLAWVLTQHYARGKHARSRAGARWIYSAPFWNGPDSIEEVRDLAMPSSLFPFAGWTFLRASDAKPSRGWFAFWELLPFVGQSPENNARPYSQKLAAFLDYGPHGGYHGHPDKLSLIFYGDGRMLANDGGIGGGYGSPLCHSWYKQTLSHNAVVVDMRSQRSSAGRLLFFKADAPWQAVSAVCDTAYPGALHQRTLILTDSYLLVHDLLRAKGSEPHVYDWVLHGAETFVPDMQMAARTEALGQKDGYEHLKEVKSARTDESWQGVFKDKKGDWRALMAGAKGAEAIVAQCPGDKEGRRGAVLLIRQNARAANFTAAMQPVGASWTPLRAIQAKEMPGDATLITVTIGANKESFLVKQDGSVRKSEESQP